MAAPAHASTGAYTEDASAAPSFAVPSGVSSGDVLVIAIFVDGTATITGLPTGFAEAENSPVALDVGGGSHSLHVAWKRATGADTGTYDITLSGSTFCAGAALRYTGCAESGDPWDAGADDAQDAASASVTPAVAITTAGADRLLVFAATIWSGGSWTQPSGYAERVDNGFGHLNVADLAQAVAGSSGSVTATSSGSDKRCAWLGALRPVAAAETHDSTAGLGLGLEVDASAAKTGAGTGTAAVTLAIAGSARKRASTAGTLDLGLDPAGDTAKSGQAVAALGLEADLATTAAAVAGPVETATTTGVQLGIIATAAKRATAGAALGLGLDVGASTGPVVTPAARTLVVDAESRTQLIGAEARTMAVTAESRTMEVLA